jgi:nitroimidazol reductase NimA-like FMN-containing flavoprotein (pyridoxamine 5'-phosphate oxidase superfamily)
MTRMADGNGLRTKRTTLKRLPDRGAHDFETMARILDEGFFCHVGFVADGQPYVVPTGYGRDGRTLYIHGSSASRMLRDLSSGVPVCVTVTLFDGLVLARSAFHHSINYRSVMVLRVARQAEGDEKLRGLRTITEHMMRGRWDDVRAPTPQELKATTVLQIDIEEASAKIRTGGPKDDEEDVALPVWAGVLPFTLVPQAPVPETGLAPGVELPPYLAMYRRSEEVAS